MSAYKNLPWTDHHYPEEDTISAKWPIVNPQNKTLYYCNPTDQATLFTNKSNWNIGTPTHRMTCCLIYKWAMAQPKDEQLIIGKPDFYNEVFTAKQQALWVHPNFVGRVISGCVPYRWSRQVRMTVNHQPKKKRQMAMVFKYSNELVLGSASQIALWYGPFRKMARTEPYDEFLAWLAFEATQDEIEEFVGPNVES